MLTMLMVQLDNNMFHRAILFTLNVCQTFNNSRFYKYDENDHYVNFKNVDKVIKLTTFITGWAFTTSKLYVRYNNCFEDCERKTTIWENNTLFIIVYRVQPNNVYKRARSDSLWKDKNKIWNKIFSFKT